MNEEKEEKNNISQGGEMVKQTEGKTYYIFEIPSTKKDDQLPEITAIVPSRAETHLG